MSTARAGTTIGIGAAATAMLAGALLLPAGDAAAQQADARWLPWLGCWTEVGASGELLCVRPAPDAPGVELVSVRDGEVVGSETLRADGVAREESRAGCTGSERAAFSSDGQRIYLRSEFVCEGGVERQGTGIVAMVSPAEWIRVETTEVAGETAAVTRRFRAAPPSAAREAGFGDVTAGREMAVDAARQAAAARPSVDDLIEAGERVDAEAVRTWVAERGEPLAVDAENLARLADAGVSETVIDVVVAVSFPERFAVDRDARGEQAVAAAGRAYPARDGTRFHGRRYWRDPFYRDPFHYGYRPFGFGFGAQPWWYGTRSPTVVVVTPRPDDDGGRVVNGRGYTQDAPSAGSRPRSGRRPAVSPPAARGSDGSVTPAGTRSGGSSSTGRKAKPRDDGGDDDS